MIATVIWARSQVLTGKLRPVHRIERGRTEGKTEEQEIRKAGAPAQA
jgi:hypothetical protein